MSDMFPWCMKPIWSIHLHSMSCWFISYANGCTCIVVMYCLLWSTKHTYIESYDVQTHTRGTHLSTSTLVSLQVRMSLFIDETEDVLQYWINDEELCYLVGWFSCPMVGFYMLDWTWEIHMAMTWALLEWFYQDFASNAQHPRDTRATPGCPWVKKMGVQVSKVSIEGFGLKWLQQGSHGS